MIRKLDSKGGSTKLSAHTLTAISQVVELVLEDGAKQATKVVSTQLTVKATHHGKQRKGQRQNTILLTIGKPAYAERQYIKRRKSLRQNPVNDVRIKWPRGSKNYRAV